MNTAQTPNADALPQKKFTIGKWECYPFTLQTAILLERINSPFMNAKIDPETNKPVVTVPTITEVAEALFVMMNWHKPTINQIIADELQFQNAVGNLCSQITMQEFATITGQLNDMMASLNNAVTESGIPQGDEKKGEIGSSAS